MRSIKRSSDDRYHQSLDDDIVCSSSTSESTAWKYLSRCHLKLKIVILIALNKNRRWSSRSEFWIRFGDFRRKKKRTAVRECAWMVLNQAHKATAEWENEFRLAVRNWANVRFENIMRAIDNFSLEFVSVIIKPFVYNECVNANANLLPSLVKRDSNQNPRKVQQSSRDSRDFNGNANSLKDRSDKIVSQQSLFQFSQAFRLFDAKTCFARQCEEQQRNKIRNKRFALFRDILEPRIRYGSHVW